MTVPPQLGKAPFAAILAGVCGGIVVSYRCSAGVWLGVALVVSGLVAGLLMERRRLYRRQWLLLLPLLTAFAGVGVMAAAVHAPVRADDLPGGCLARGVVRGVTPTDGGERLEVELQALTHPGSGTVLPLRSRAYVYVDSARFERGQTLSFPGYFSEPAGDDSYRGYMFGKGVDLVAYLPDSLVVVTGSVPLWDDVPAAMQRSCVHALDGSRLSVQGRGFLKALLIGDRAELDPDVRQDFADAGIVHLLAVSGLHVGILVALVALLLLPLNLLGLRWLRFLLVAAGVWVYAALTGMNPPVVRAAVMVTCVMLSMLLERPGTVLNSLCVAGCGILLVDPRSLFDAGLLLSFMVTGAIMLFAEPLTPGRTNRRNRRRRGVLQMLVVPCVAFMVSWVLTARYFHSVPLIFLPLNLLMAPLLPLYFWLGAGYLLLRLCGLDAGWWAALLDGGYDCLREMAGWIASLPGATCSIWLPEVAAWLYLGGVLAFAFALVYKRRAWWGIAIAAAAASMIAICVLPTGCPPDRVEVTGNWKQTTVSVTTRGRTERASLPQDTLLACRINGSLILLIDAPFSESSVASAPASADAIIIGPRYKGTLKQLQTHFKADTICLHPALPLDRRDELTTRSAFPF